MREGAVEEIRLTIPSERAYYGVAHLVLGGLAARLNLTIEALEDLQLAIDGLLDRHGDGADVTVAVRLAGEVLEARVGPFAIGSTGPELEREPGDEMTLRRLLETLVDDVSVETDDGAEWVEVSKRLPQNGHRS